MSGHDANRREVLGASALAALWGLAAPVLAADRPAARKLFAGTALANNPLASRFEVLPPDVHAPAKPLQTPAGDRPLSVLRSPATLVTLWGEFCAPCMMEMPDLASLGDRYRAAGFNVVALHIGGTMQAAGDKLKSLHAATIPSWNDSDATVAKALATPPGEHGFTLPCNILLDAHGRVRGRAFGAQSLTPTSTTAKVGQPLTAAAKERMLHMKSTWSLPVADQFAQALAGGLLQQLRA